MALFLSRLIINNVLILLVAVNATAAGNLMLFPTRAIFDKNRRSMQIDLTNSGNETVTYRLSLENKRMTVNGQFVPAEPALPGELHADKILQFSPRQIELAPGAGQTVRIILRKPADLPIGEYRSHLVFSRLPPAAPIVSGDKKKSKQIGIKLIPLIGASIPVIVQNGETSASIALTDLKYLRTKNKEAPTLEVSIERTGNRSVYGDFVVKYKSPKGVEKEVANILGVAVYSPYPKRIAKISLQPDLDYVSGGKILISFNETRAAGGKLLSESSIEIP